MISIIKALGKTYKNIVLEDNESVHGGISHTNETLEEFMNYLDIKETDDYGELCIRLERCGIKAVRPFMYIDLSDNSNNINLDKCNKINEYCFTINECFKKLIKYDMIYCKKFIDENINNLYYDEDCGAWFIEGLEIVDELWYNHNTLLHPKELIGYIEEYIETKYELNRL